MSFFKAYDMRGTFGADFDLDLVYRVGKALPAVVGGGRWLVGRDGRTTSPAVHDALVKGLFEAGAEVSDLGVSSTPMVYFFTAEDGFDGSVMITASHNPPADNGLKVSRRGALPVGYANGLNAVEALTRKDAARVKAAPPARRPASVKDAFQRYAAWQRARLPDLTGLRFAVDCSNGMGALLARELFPQAILLNDTVDGSFPAHAPNPLLAAAREDLARVVREEHLDCGVIFDGDADRAMFVDETGAFIQPDYLIPVVAHETRAALGAAAPSAIVLHDVRTSRSAIDALREDGFEPVMVPVGHAFAKPKMRALKALCGGELAGHYYFSEFANCDSGVLAAMRLLGAFARAKRGAQAVSAFLAPICRRLANSGETNFRVADKPAAIRRVIAAAKTLGEETARSMIDGYRLEYKEGWISIRESNTEPYLRLLAECDTPECLTAWMATLKSAVESA